MTHQRTRHPLDNSPPRISDLPPEHALIVLAERDRAARARWLTQRAPRPLTARLRARLNLARKEIRA